MYLRTILVWALGLPVTGALFLLVLLSLLIDRNGRFVHSIGAFWCRIIVRLSGVKVSLQGLDHLPLDRPVVMLSNHIGAFDIPVLQGWLPLQFRWVSKKSLFKIPVIGWSMTLAGYISIDRENSPRAFRGIIKAAKKIKNGTSVLVFPEGTRSPTGRLLPFKKGPFFLASKSGVDIVPLSVRGTRDIMKKGSLAINPSEVQITIGSPIPTGGLDEKALMKKSREAIKNLLVS
ncbi:MAG: lysophospholipid acyltransferase family protein [Thermodesulfobacteriota bacterium]